MLNRTALTPAQQLDLVRALLDALLEAVTVAGSAGVPGGTLYATMMGHGCDLRTFERLMGILVDSGRVIKEGHHYRVPDPK